MVLRPVLRSLGLLPLPALCLGLAAQSVGVTTADLRGQVLTAGGTAVGGARARLTQDATLQTRVVVTDAAGGFGFHLLPPGSYTLTVETREAGTQTLRGLQLRLGQTADVQVELGPVEASAVVEVTGSTSVADPTRTQLAAAIDQTFITSLPINRRDFTAFTLTTPRVAPDNGPARSLGAAAASGLSFSGQSARQNNIMVDGLDNNDVSVGSARTTFSQEAIQEFLVVANGFSAEYGRAAGGTLNIVTRSGGNAFAGSLFHFFRNDSLEARRPLSGRTIPFQQEQTGASVSGPILADRLFYFAAVERFNQEDHNQNTIDPAAAAALRTQTGIPVSPGIQPFRETVTTALVKLDWMPSDLSHWNLRYSQARETNGNQLPWSGQVDRSQGGAREIQDWAFSLGHLWTGSPGFLNDFRAQVSSRDHQLLSLDDTRSPTIRITGYANAGTQGLLPQVRTERSLQVADSATWFLGRHTLKTGVDLLQTQVNGSIPIDFYGFYSFQALGLVGPLLFADGLQAFTSTAAGGGQFMNPFNGQPGLPAAFVQGFGDSTVAFTGRYDSAFLQDDWQLSPTFTLKLGLRFDREQLPSFRNTPDYEALQAGGPAQLAGFMVYPLPGSSGATGSPGGPYLTRNLTQVSLDWSSARVSPRLAFTWQATPMARLYGGYGHFSGRTQLGPFAAVYLNNGTNLRTVVQVANADYLQVGPGTFLPAPWYSWAQPNHRYASLADVPASAARTSLLLPGASEMPLTRQATLGLELVPRPNLRFTFDAAYVVGQHFLNARDINALIPNPGADFSQPDSPGNPYVRRMDTRYSSVFRYDGSGESRCWSVSAGTAWQIQDLLSLTASYTWSRAEDNYLDWLTNFSPANTFDPQREMGLSNQDQRHRLLLSLVANTSGFTHPWARNWTVSLLGRLASGRPYSRLTGLDNDYGTLNGTPYGNGDGGDLPVDRPAGTSRNGERLPFTRNVDLRIARTFRLRKGLSLEAMADVFNVFNHYNVSQVQAFLNAPGYGQPIVQSNVDFNRQVQLGARLRF